MTPILCFNPNRLLRYLYRVFSVCIVTWKKYSFWCPCNNASDLNDVTTFPFSSSSSTPFVAFPFAAAENVVHSDFFLSAFFLHYRITGYQQQQMILSNYSLQAENRCLIGQDDDVCSRKTGAHHSRVMQDRRDEREETRRIRSCKPCLPALVPLSLLNSLIWLLCVQRTHVFRTSESGIIRNHNSQRS